MRMSSPRAPSGGLRSRAEFKYLSRPADARGAILYNDLGLFEIVNSDAASFAAQRCAAPVPGNPDRTRTEKHCVQIPVDESGELFAERISRRQDADRINCMQIVND